MTITLKIQNETQNFVFPESVPVRDVLASAGLPVRTILGVRNETGVMELDDLLTEDACIAPLTLMDAEGRRIYERSVRFVMLMALEELFPGKRVRIEHSVPGGIYVRLPGMILTSDDVDRIEQVMRRIADADLPFTSTYWSQQEVKNYFASLGQQDKLDLLEYRKAPVIRMYECNG